VVQRPKALLAHLQWAKLKHLFILQENHSNEQYNKRMPVWRPALPAFLDNEGAFTLNLLPLELIFIEMLNNIRYNYV
jgi:hypothetical protein